MTKLLLTSIMFFSQLAFAANSNSSWDEIFQQGLWPDAPKIKMSSTFVNVLDTCVEGDNIRAVNPHRKECIAYDNQNEGRERCTKYVDVYLSTPIAYSYSYCKEWRAGGEGGCDVYESDTTTHPLDYMIDVYSNWGDNGERAEFSKSFNIPSCG